MPRLTIVSSDQPASLIERLALDLGTAPLGPFERETIIVGSRGAERWLRHELARRHGCAAGLDFPFAASFFTSVAEGLVAGEQVAGGAATHRSDDERQRLTWRIHGLLEDDLAAEPGFEAIRAYVGSRAEHDSRKLLGLAGVLADRFAEYQLYRPDVLLGWSQGEIPADGPAVWQAALWRKLFPDRDGPIQPVRLYAEALERLHAATSIPRGLPPRLSVFGIDSLPPIFVRLLHGVARHVPVRVYLQAPPRRTWADGAGNPLFATFGSVVREFVALLEDLATPAGSIAVDEHHAGAAPDDASMLARLQSDIREGVHRVRGASPATLSARDASIRVHRCHSPMREMEVLRDQLLAAFAADGSLRPHDILLLVPDVTTYAPMVDAVFGIGETGLPRIPHRIADRPVVQESRMADAALRTLRLVGARWTATEIVELLDLPPVQRAAGLEGDAIHKVIGWIEDTNIRWGRDGAMRRDLFALPAVDANSWRAGIDRLLMGYAMGRTNEPVDGIYPAAGDTIGDPETLGLFAQFIDTLFDTLTDWRTGRTLAEWSVTLRTAFTRLLATSDDDQAVELAELLTAVDALATLDAGDGAARVVELAVVRDWLEQRLAGEGHAAGFLAGGMTVAELRPMRVVPHRLVAIAGLDDASFPRRHDRPAFDLMATRCAGDRNRRADDRQLFLDTLLAAGDQLILSYVARSARDNTERAASVVVAQLLDVIDDSFASPDPARRARRVVEVEHRLQPFSAAYFTGTPGDPLFSYSRVNAQALERAATGTRIPASPFSPAVIAVAEDMEGSPEIRLDELIACWANPARFFCTRTLGIRLPRDLGALEECEPLTVDALDRYKVHDAMLGRHLAGARDLSRERAEAVSLGRLPSGALGPVWFDALDAELQDLLDRLGAPSFDEPCAVNVAGDGWRLVGRVGELTTDGLIHVRPGACRPQDRMRAWITHLAVSATFKEPLTTRFVARTEDVRFRPVVDPLAPLAALVQGYLAARTQPLPFFPRASHDFVKQELLWEEKRRTSKGTVRKPSLDVARAAFREREFERGPRGDVEDEYVALCWRGREPLDDAVDEFVRWSDLFWRPAMQSLGSTDDSE